MGYSFHLSEKESFICIIPDRIAHTRLCYTSLAGMRGSSTSLPTSKHFTTERCSAPQYSPYGFVHYPLLVYATGSLVSSLQKVYDILKVKSKADTMFQIQTFTSQCYQ